MAWFIGLMSGTSLDGVDAVLVECQNGHPTVPDPDSAPGRRHVHIAMPMALRAELLTLNTSGADELHRSALASTALMALYAEAVAAVLAQAGLTAAEVRAIGAHGQTVRHRPGEFDGIGYTLQLMNGALLAEHTGIDVVCDFRSRDLAAGGQGAPLLPAFHAACFARPGRDRAVLNLGGIANLSLLAGDGGVSGFDTGPANVLLDLWCQRHRGEDFDPDGRWAAGGTVDEALLCQWLQSEPYFVLPPPKSSGRDRFNVQWLDSRLAGTDLDPQDVMATLVELTARSVVEQLLCYAPATTDLLVCGGGTRNRHLMRRLQALLGSERPVNSTAKEGVPPDQVEALAFGWLAAAQLARLPGNLPAVTGARGLRLLGALYPAVTFATDMTRGNPNDLRAPDPA